MIRILTPPPPTNGAMLNRRYKGFRPERASCIGPGHRLRSFARPFELRPGVKEHRFFVNGELWQSEF